VGPIRPDAGGRALESFLNENPKRTTTRRMPWVFGREGGGRALRGDEVVTMT
jgi:hypothetical protein